MTLSGAFPMGMEKWKNALMMMGGVLVGWMVSPVVWLVAGPLRILVLMMAQASQESGYNSTVWLLRREDAAQGAAVRQILVVDWPPNLWLRCASLHVDAWVGGNDPVWLCRCVVRRLEH